MSDSLITNTIFNQIMDIRNSGETNMFDVNAVASIANERNHFELVNLIIDNKKAYCDFILTGKRKEKTN